MDDERLKRSTFLTGKYFDEQLERIREIRASERRFYQKVTDLYATVQNKIHFAVHGHTAAELIVACADALKDHMAGRHGRQNQTFRCDSGEKLSLGR